MKKKFLITQILIVIMLGITLVGYTYSWSQRSAVQGGYMVTPMTLTYSANINGNSCSGVTYKGTKNNETGEITYNTATAVSNLSSTSVTDGTVLYFRTDITNAADVATNVSLFIDVNYSPTLEGKYFVTTSTPTVDRFSYASQGTSNGNNFVRWIPVVAQYEIPAGANNSVNAFIEWYVEFEGTGNFQIDKIVLANN